MLDFGLRSAASQITGPTVATRRDRCRLRSNAPACELSERRTTPCWGSAGGQGTANEERSSILKVAESRGSVDHQLATQRMGTS